MWRGYGILRCGSRCAEAAAEGYQQGVHSPDRSLWVESHISSRITESRFARRCLLNDDDPAINLAGKGLDSYKPRISPNSGFVLNS
jgi:hypothetical protein